jgi:hypothetical protein
MALPSLDTTANDQTISAIDKLGKAIMEKASMSIQGATKSIVPSIPKMINELTDDLAKGPVHSFGKVIRKLENMVETLGLDLRSYNNDLADMLQSREDQARKSEQTVQKLREQNIVARVNKDTKEVEILTRSQIRQEEKLIEKKTKTIKLLEKEIKLDTKNLQERDNLSPREKGDTKKRIEANALKLDKLTAERDEQANDVGTTVDTGRTEKGLPMFLEMMKEGFLEPFRAIGESFNMMKDMGKGTAELFNFLSGGLFLKAFKGLTKGLKAIGGFFTLARLVLVAKFALVIGAITFVAAKINKIKDFFAGIVDYFRESKLGKLLGLSKKEKPEEKKERIRKSRSTGTSMVDLDDHYGADTPKVEALANENSFPTVDKTLDNKNIIKGANAQDLSKMSNAKLYDDTKTQHDALLEFDKLSKDANSQIANGGQVIINNAPTTVSSQTSGSVTSGFVNNEPDETITNTSRSRWNNM